jgi:type I restriction enzyme, S subunit
MSNDELPEGWASCLMGDIAEVVGGGTPRSTDPANFTANGIPWITPADLSGFTDVWIERGERCLTKAGYDSCSARLVPPGTVLMSSRAPIGYFAIAANELCTNQGFKSFVLPPEFDSQFVYYWLRSIRDEIEHMGSGSTFLEVSGSRCREIPLIIAPLAEQKRIVAKVEQLLARVNAARERLVRVPAILKRFRQSVLAAACSGRLSEIWRSCEIELRHAGKDLADLPEGALGENGETYPKNWDS